MAGDQLRRDRPEPYHFFINKKLYSNSVFTEMKIIGNRITEYFSVFYVADSSAIVM